MKILLLSNWSDPILGLKWFCFFVVLWIILFVAGRLATGWRVTFSKCKLFESNSELVLYILRILDAICCLLCLMWSAIAWIIN